MKLLQTTTAAIAAVLASSLAAAAPAAPAARFCDGAVCYSEFISPQSIAYRVAIPDTAVSGTPFDVLIQIVAPKRIGWAAIAWGGQMPNNPITLAWSNGASGVVASSRWATGRVAPQAYAGASLTVFPTSTTNSTHWRLDALCTGCSRWQGSTGLNPASASQQIAWGMTTRAPATPASNTSTITIHESKGRVAIDLASARIANFTSIVAAKRGALV